MTDRYLKFILTVIAAELLWLGVKDVGTPVNAQAGQQPMPVVVRGIEIDPANPGALPVFAVRPLRVEADAALPIRSDGPLPVSVGGTLTVDVSRPVEVFAQQPLPVQSVPYTPSERPGE